jgi:predicted deacylase
MAWRRSANLAVVGSAARVAVLDLTDLAAPPHVLEGSAAAIWAAVDGARGTTAIIEEVASACGVAPAAIAADVQGFLALLADQGLLERVP